MKRYGRYSGYLGLRTYLGLVDCCRLCFSSAQRSCPAPCRDGGLYSSEPSHPGFRCRLCHVAVGCVLIAVRCDRFAIGFIAIATGRCLCVRSAVVTVGRVFLLMVDHSALGNRVPSKGWGGVDPHHPLLRVVTITVGSRPSVCWPGTQLD